MEYFVASSPDVEWIYDETREKGTIKNVPIFELGVHRGNNYDTAWADSAISIFSRNKTERSYLPTIILGHTPDNEIVERPAVGFIDNMRLEGKKIVVDFVDVVKEAFEAIKRGMYPYRSVEIIRQSFITAVALLGGHAPEIKFPPLLYGADKGEWVSCDSDPVTEKEEHMSDQAQINLDDYVPKSEYEALAQRLREVQRLAEQAKAAKFQEHLRELGLTPAVCGADETKVVAHFCAKSEAMEKFNDEEVSLGDAIHKFVAMIVEQAGKNALLVPKPVESVEVKPIEKHEEEDDSVPTAAQKEKYGYKISRFDADVLDKVEEIKKEKPGISEWAAVAEARKAILSKGV